MEAGSQTAVLQKLLDGLCQETDPAKIYKILKEMSSVPILCDRLAEIGFRKTIKRLKKEQLLVRFVKDLVGKWSTGSLPEAQAEQTKKDFGLEMSLKRRGGQSTSAEEKPQQCTSQEARRDGREDFLWLSSHSPGKIPCLSPSRSRKSQARSKLRAPQSRSLHCGETRSPEQQLGFQNPVQVGTSWASLEEPWQHERAGPLSGKPGAGAGKHKGLVFGGHRKSQPPGHWEQGESPGAGSLWPCLNAECCPPCSSVQPPCMRKRELLSLVEAQRPPAKLPRGECPTSEDLSPIAAWAIPESQSSGQACFSRGDVLEPLSSQLDQEASPWESVIRKNHKSQVYSGVRPADHLQKNSHLRLLEDKSAGTRDVAQCQAGKDQAGPGKPEEKSRPKTQSCKQTQRRPESPTPLQPQKSQEERLQALRARIQSRRAKMQQARQTRMISFHTQLKGPGQQGQPGTTGAASAQNSNSLPEAPVHPGAQKAPYLPSGERGSKKPPAKKPAPLMAKALKDYSRRFFARKRM